MKKNDITLCTCAFGLHAGEEHLFRSRFEQAMAAGFNGFEISMFEDGNVKAIADAARACGAKIIAVHGVVGYDSLSNDKNKRDAELTRALKYLEPLAEFAPCNLVEHYLDRTLDPVPGQFFHDSMARHLEAVEKIGFHFCMENVPYWPTAYERYSPLAEVAYFARSFGRDRMSLTIDVNHLNLQEEPVKALSEIVRGLVRHIHISDNHGRLEEHLLPGEGIIDFPPILRAVRQNGYTGPFNFECGFPKGTEINQTAFCDLYSRIQRIMEPFCQPDFEGDPLLSGDNSAKKSPKRLG